MGFFLRAPVVNDRLYHTAKSAVGARTRARAPLPPFPRTIPAGRRSLCSRTTAGGPEPSSDGSAQRQTRPTKEACASVRPCWDEPSLGAMKNNSGPTNDTTCSVLLLWHQYPTSRLLNPPSCFVPSRRASSASPCGRISFSSARLALFTAPHSDAGFVGCRGRIVSQPGRAYRGLGL